MKIAVLVDDSGNTLAMNESGKFVLYEKDINGCWIISKTCPYSMQNVTNAGQIRQILRKIIADFGDCRTLLAKEINGIYFTVFEGACYNIWEIDGSAENSLDYIEESELQEKNKKIKTAADYSPVEKEKGHYYVNLIEIMYDSQVSSKQVLMPFFEKGGFEVLEIDCDHLPRWFNKELESFHLKVKAEHTDFGMKAYVTKG